MEIINLRDKKLGKFEDEGDDNDEVDDFEDFEDDFIDKTAGLKFPKRPRGRMNPREVTDLRPGVKDKNRVNVFLGGRFAFSLTINQVSDFGIRVGKVYTREQINEFQSASDFGKLFQRTLEYAFTRPHSEREIRNYLRRKQFKRKIEQQRYDDFLKRLENDEEYRQEVREIRQKVHDKNEQLKEKREQRRKKNPDSNKDLGTDSFAKSTGVDRDSEYADNCFEYRGFARTNLPRKPAAPIKDEDIDAVIAKLIDMKVIDDEAFAKYFVENRNRIKGTSEKKLWLELRVKGVSEDIIKEVMGEDENGEKARDDEIEIKKVIAKKRRRGYDDRKLIQHLLRQGFRYDLIKRAINEPIEDEYYF